MGIEQAQPSCKARYVHGARTTAATHRQVCRAVCHHSVAVVVVGLVAAGGGAIPAGHAAGGGAQPQQAGQASGGKRGGGGGSGRMAAAGGGSAADAQGLDARHGGRSGVSWSVRGRVARGRDP